MHWRSFICNTGLFHEMLCTRFARFIVIKVLRLQFFQRNKTMALTQFQGLNNKQMFFSARSLHNTITLSGSLQCFYPSLQPPRSCSHPPLLSRWHYSPALCASLGLDLLSSSGLWQGTYHWIKQWAIHDMG